MFDLNDDNLDAKIDVTTTLSVTFGLLALSLLSWWGS